MTYSNWFQSICANEFLSVPIHRFQLVPTGFNQYSIAIPINCSKVKLYRLLLTCRPADRSALDADSQPVGVPSDVLSVPDTEGRYYFCILSPQPLESETSLPLDHPVRPQRHLSVHTYTTVAGLAATSAFKVYHITTSHIAVSHCTISHCIRVHGIIEA